MKNVLGLALVLGLCLITTQTFALTKAELLTQVKETTFVDGGKIGFVVNNLELVGTEADGAKKYRVSVREENGLYCQYRVIFFYVIDEGKPTEKAFFVPRYGNKQTVIGK